MLPPDPPALMQRVESICVDGEELKLTDELRTEYETLYAACVVIPRRKENVEMAIDQILRGRARYVAVSAPLGVPWYVTGILHLMECDSRFDCHLHNGNPLTARTVDVPAGRPLDGHPPFTWEWSATDALRFEGFDQWHDWSVAGTLFRLESYNGFGARNHGVHTPYLWAGAFIDANGNGVFDTNEKPIYVGGKYVKDHVWNPAAQSKQIGAAVILRRMMDQSLAIANEAARMIVSR